jgi:hypothetical protein
MVYGHTAAPRVDFSADNTFGWAPLTAQFTDNSPGATAQHWRFGDGTDSDAASPTHEYLSGGGYDVYLENVQADGWHNHTNKKMIVVLADTITFPNTGLATGDTLRLPVNLTNSQPLESIKIPVSYAGPIDLEYVGLTTAGTRADYFELATIVTVSPSTHRLVFQLTASGGQYQPPLPPGDGTIAYLKFLYVGGGGLTWIDTTHFSGHPLECDAGYVSYAPKIVKGNVFVSLCGDINGSGAVDVADLTFIVDFLFGGGPPPNPYLAGDINASGAVDVADLTYMVDYLFGGGPPPQCE